MYIAAQVCILDSKLVGMAIAIIEKTTLNNEK